VEAAAVLEGRRVVAVRLAWRRKSEAGLKAAFTALQDRLPVDYGGLGNAREVRQIVRR
jgi:hypothetical protein